MSRTTYRHADCLHLAGAIRRIGRGLGSEIGAAGETFTVLSSAVDVPPPLRRYYARVGKKLTTTGNRLTMNMKSAASEGWRLSMRIHSALGQLHLSEEELERLRHINSRLLKLEKSLKQMVDGLRERLEGLDPSGVEWDEWDGIDMTLCVRIGYDAERPSYDPDASMLPSHQTVVIPRSCKREIDVVFE